MPKFKWKPSEVFEKVWDYLNKQKEEQEIIVLISNKETKEIRTLAQNNTFWKLFTDIGNHLWEDKHDVHDMLLGWVFGTHTVKLGRIEREVLNEKHTSKLTKEQGIKFIDTILAFCRKYNLPITITSREIKDLYESY